MSPRTASRFQNPLRLTALALAAIQFTSPAAALDIPAGTTRVMQPFEVGDFSVYGTLFNEVPAGVGAIQMQRLEIAGPSNGGQGVVYNRLGGSMSMPTSGLVNWGGTFHNQTGARLSLPALNVYLQSALENDFGATFYNQSGASLETVALVRNQGGSTFINESTNTLLRLGSVRATDGKIDNKGAGTLFDNRDGAALQMVDTTFLINSSGATFRNRNQATLTASGSAQVVNSSTFENSNGAGVRVSGGILFNSAGGSFNNLSGASIATSGGGLVVNQGSGSVLTNAGGASITLTDFGSNLLNKTGAQLTNTGVGTRISVDGAEFRNQATSTFSNLAGALVDLKSGYLTNDAAAGWLNDGNGTHVDVGALGRFYNSGTFTNQNKAFVGMAGSTVNQGTGQFQNTSGGTVSLAVGSNSSGVVPGFTSFGVVSNLGAGTSFTVNAGTQFWTSGALAQVYNNLGAQMSVSGSGASINNLETSSLTNNGAGTVLAVSLGGTLNNNSYATLNNIGGAQMSVFSATLNNSDNGRLINDGTGTKLSLSFGVLNNAASLTNRNAALIDIGSGSTFTNSASGTVSNASGATLKIAGALASDGQITNSAIVTMAGGSQVSGAGTFVQNDAAAVTDVNGNWTQGVTQVLAGTFRGTGVIGGAVLNSAAITALGTGLTFSGAVSGTGSFLGTTRFNGSVDPGGANGALGFMNVSSAVMGASNRLKIEIGGLTQGSGYDALLGGSITLGGTLAVSLVPTFNTGSIPTLKLGDSFDVLSGTSLTGDFTGFDLPGLSAGLAWTHQTVTTSTAFVTTQAYRLAITAVPEPGAWALMLAGLAATSAVARRRRARV